MFHPPMNKLVQKAGDQYTLVIAASKRAKQVVEDKIYYAENGELIRPISSAIQEFYNDKIVIKKGE